MLTARQAELHRFIFDYMRSHGYCPSHDEMRVALGFRPGGAVSHILARLEERGYVERTPHRYRSIKLLKDPPLLHTAYFKAVYDHTEEWSELVPLEEVCDGSSS